MTDYLGSLVDDRYLVESILGQGGMGIVYQGTHAVVGRKVAIKFLSSEYSGNPEVVRRFFREAQSAAAIGHKNIIDILDVGISKFNDPYLVMEYLEGECLSSLLDRTGPVDQATACGVLEPVLLALAATHEKDIIHRDLKPDNIFLVKDPVDGSITVKLIDFGISKIRRAMENNHLTNVGAVLGTPLYMSPEQASGIEIDNRSDIYSMGVILFEMLTGSMPFEGANSQETMLNVISGTPKNPRDLNPNFPEVARPIIERAMQKRPEERYQSAQEMLQDLRKMPGFSVRNVLLNDWASGIIKDDCAIGDLGPRHTGHESGDLAARLFEEITSHTPKDWTTRPTENLPRRRPLAIWMIGISAVLLFGAALLLWRISKDGAIPEQVVPPISSLTPGIDEPPAAESDPSKSDAPKVLDVQIAVTGAPLGAHYYYGETPVPSNIFRVPTGSTPINLRVEAPGYRPFEQLVTPEKNVTVRVNMIPEKGAAPATGRFIKGRRSTEIAKDFE